MHGVLKLAGVLVLGALGTILALVVAFEHADIVHTPAEYDSAMATAVFSRLDIYLPHTTIYVRSRNSDGLLEALRRQHPKLVLLPWSERPFDASCQEDAAGICRRDDYISVNVLSFPFWRTALVQFGTYNGGGETILVRIGKAWQVLGTRAARG